MELLHTEAPRFLRYIIVGVSTFCVDLVLLYCLVQYASIDYRYAAACSYLIAVTLNYTFSRTYVFIGSKRDMMTGYMYFVVFCVISALTTSLLLWVCVSHFGMYYLYAKVCIATVLGIGTYTFNTVVLFHDVRKAVLN